MSLFKIKTTELLARDFSHTLVDYKTRFSNPRNIREVHYEIAEQALQKPQMPKQLSKAQFECFLEAIARIISEFVCMLEVKPEAPENVLELTDEEMQDVLWLDGQLTHCVEDFGMSGRLYAGMLEEKSRELIKGRTPRQILEQLANDQWPTWKATGSIEGDSWPKCFSNIAYTYFLDRLKPLFEEQNHKYQRNPPGLQTEVHRTLARAYFEPSNQVKTGLKRPFIVIDSQEQPVAHSALDLVGEFKDELFPAGVLNVSVIRSLQRRMQQNLKLLGSVSAHRLIRWVASECAANFRIGKTFNESRCLRWGGGMEILANAIGEPNPSSGKTQRKLRCILEAGNMLHIQWPTGHRISGLWMTRYFEACGWQSALSEIDAAPFFAPGFAHRYKLKSKQIIPVVALPPGISKANSRHQGPLAACQLELIALMTERKDQIARHGGVLISPKERAQIAQVYGIKHQVFEEYFERWLQNTDDEPQMFEEVAPQRYLLANNELFGEARTFLHEGGRRSEVSRQARKKKRQKKG